MIYTLIKVGTPVGGKPSASLNKATLLLWELGGGAEWAPGVPYS